MAHQVGEKDEGAPEDAYQDEVLPLVVGADLGAELSHAALEIVTRDEALADPRIRGFPHRGDVTLRRAKGFVDRGLVRDDAPRRAVLAFAALLVALALMPAASADAASRLGLRVNEGGSTVAATYAPRQDPVERSIKLNGRHVEDVFYGAPPEGRRVLLGLDEGVHFGRNTLRVRALYPDGRVVKKVRRFRVDSRRPLAGITGPRELHDGIPMMLRARAAPRGTSRAHRRAFRREQGDVRHTWKVLEAPDGAEADLKRAHARRPRFRPDVPGIYRIGLSVRRLGNSGRSPRAAGGGSRTVSVPLEVESSEASKAGVFVSTEPLDSAGNPTALEIHSGSAAGTYPLGSQNGKAGPIVNLIFDRCTLSPIGGPLYIGADGGATLISAVTAAQSQLANTGCEALVITAGADYGQIGSFGQTLDTLTGQRTENFPAAGSNPIWAIWTPPPAGSPANTKGRGVSNFPYFDSTSTAGRMSGELVPDQNGNYVFRRSTAPTLGQQNTQLRFSMDDTGITLPTQGGQPSKVAAGNPGCPDNGRGGFQLLVVFAIGPDVLEEITLEESGVTINGKSLGNGDTFWVNSCDSEQEVGTAYAVALAEVIGQVGTNFNDQPAMIFLQGVGNALPPASQMTGEQQQALREVAGVITAAGGSGGAFLNNEAATTGPGYSFAGVSWPLEGGARTGTEVSSSTPGGPPAQLDGFVKPDRIGRLAPATATPAADVLGPDFTNYRVTESASAIVNPETQFTPTPFPGAGNEEWENAMYYLSKNVFKPALTYDPTTACYAPKVDSNWVVYDIRATYCGGGGGASCGYPWDTYSNLIQPGDKGAQYVAGNGFSAETWSDVLAQLRDEEFPMVVNLNCNTGSYQLAYGTASQDGLLEVSEMVVTMNSYIKQILDEAAKIEAIVGDIGEVVASLSNVVAVAASMAEKWPAMNFAWGLQGAIDLIESYAALGLELAKVFAPLPPSTTATAYASMLENGLESASAGLGAPRDQIASDWGRLQAYEAAGLDVNSSDVDAAAAGLSYGTYDRIWRQLLPSSFLPTHLLVSVHAGDTPPVDPPTWECIIDPSLNDPGETAPFANFPANSYTLHPEGATDANPTGLEGYALAANYYSDDFYEPFPPPDKEVLSQLFSPLSDPGAEDPLPPVANGQATSLGILKEQYYADVIESGQAANPSQVLEAGANNGYCPYP
jgi:hypothetical protein